MKTIVTQSSFIDAFTRAGRARQFSLPALRLLLEYFEQHEKDTGEEIELDVSAICCEYAESTASEIAHDYSIDFDESDDKADTVREYLINYTILVGKTPDGFVYLQF